MNNKEEIKIFLEISIPLTGFSSSELLGTGMLETYFNTVVENMGKSTTEYFFKQAKEILLKTEGNEDKRNEEIAANLMPLSSYDGLAQNIITMWYTGNWNNNVITPQAYVQGLIWNVAEAHPPGAKQPGYGSWSLPPVDKSI